MTCEAPNHQQRAEGGMVGKRQNCSQSPLGAHLQLRGDLGDHALTPLQDCWR